MSSSEVNIDQSTPVGATLFQRQQKLEQAYTFRQLSRLCALETLDIRGYGDRPQPTQGLNFSSQDEKIESHKTLKNLKLFLTRYQCDYKTKMWIKENWPNCL
ncbi:hypothetical protein BGZ76_004198, partial [Entomortierella beljakovae]